MEASLATLKNQFPTLPQDVVKKIYKCRLERMKTLTCLGLPEHIRWIVEAKVRLGGELNDSFIKRLPGLGRSSYSKKRRAKRMRICHKCARWNCDTRCKNPGYVSINREDKINCIKYGLSKESLDNILETLETYHCGVVQRILLDLWELFRQEKQRYSLGNLTLKDPVCKLIRKLDGKPILDS